MARFMRKGRTKIWFVETLAIPESPTVEEVTMGTNLTPQIAEINGFTFSNSPIQTPDMDTKFVSQIPGEDTTEDSSMVFYEDESSNPIKAALPKDKTGYIVIFPSGYGTGQTTPQPGNNVEVWPVTVSSSARQYSAGNDAAQYEISFACTQEPHIDVSVQGSLPVVAPTTAPGNLTAIAQSDSEILLDWDPVDGAESYEYRVDGGAEVSTGAATAALVSGLTPSTEYDFEVRAVNSEGAGPWSEVVSETTEA